uniref:EF-hand domain pair n=1 Tax=Tanacetum cinerariifolium TaxID=118510 RepID=A0A699H6M4_TANCI|nr:EF-hand domain pair [Tanacetum cinerariifolium]
MNGVRFVVHNRDERRTTQNSGICSPGEKDRELYYGQLEEILEFSYRVNCEDEAKRHNSRAKTKTFEEYYFLLLYAVSSNEDTAYQRQLEEEKAHRRVQEYNWESATYGKIWYDEDFHYLISFEKEFLAIVYNDALTSEPKVSFDFENEYPTIVYNNTLTSKPKVSIDFENEFPAIVYNDASISETKISAEPTFSTASLSFINLLVCVYCFTCHQNLSLDDLDFTTLNIDGRLMDVDALPDIIDVDRDDDSTDDEDALPHDLEDYDDEDLTNDDDDDDDMSTNVAQGHGGDGGGDDRLPPLQIGGRCQRHLKTQQGRQESRQTQYPRANQECRPPQGDRQGVPDALTFLAQDRGGAKGGDPNVPRTSPRQIGMRNLPFGLIPSTMPGVLKMLKTGQRAQSYAGRDLDHLLSSEICM